ncbi:DUF4017 family protein [Candidatus Dependentiae bacterium]|nr:DUF4017 family protein [Candidatus Dependentiae bacterium]MBU4387615.1 DUF4017 family protein [Candidatus Dependentiae bacterium]
MKIPGRCGCKFNSVKHKFTIIIICSSSRGYNHFGWRLYINGKIAHIKIFLNIKIIVCQSM